MPAATAAMTDLDCRSLTPSAREARVLAAQVM